MMLAVKKCKLVTIMLYGVFNNCLNWYVWSYKACRSLNILDTQSTFIRVPVRDTCGTADVSMSGLLA